MPQTSLTCEVPDDISHRKEDKTPVKVLLYTTLGCHLCEDAMDLLKQYRTQQVTEPMAENAGTEEIEIEEIEISESESLVESYGLRIPVISKLHTSEELDWPFTLNDLTRYLSPSDLL